MKARIYGSLVAVGAMLLVRQLQVTDLVSRDHHSALWWALESGRWVIHGAIVWLLASMALMLSRRLESAERRLNEIGVILEIEKLELDIVAEEGVLSEQ